MTTLKEAVVICILLTPLAIVACLFVLVCWK